MTKHPKEADRLKKIVEAFPKLTVTVLGDLVADEFVFGEISRVSREAPVLILKLEERSQPKRAPVDWAGNVSFALGLILIMVSVTYGIRPYGHSPTGGGSPRVIALLFGGVASLIAFAVIERQVANPVFRLPLFRIRAFTFGTLST